MAFGIGANDVSNSMGTSVGSGTITAKQAIIIALIFESAGAYLAGGEVTETIKSGVIDPTQFVEMPDVLALGMLSALFASGAWLFIAPRLYDDILKSGKQIRISFAGREASAAPACGSPYLHAKQQAQLINDALAIEAEQSGDSQ